ncbi:MAG: flagellar filament capping protein FliD [Desulfuromonadales bacterium]
MAISFGGLATGLDTNSIVSQLMQLERQPITRLQNDKSYHSSRLMALTQFDGKLQGFLSKLGSLDDADELQSKKATLNKDDFLSATASTTAAPGSYQIEVVGMAQVQKSVSQGFADKAASTFGTGILKLTVGDGEPLEITLDETNNSLEGVMKAINESGAGVSAAIINDGTASPYRLVLTGAEVATGFTLDDAGLTGQSYNTAEPLVAVTQTAQQAHIRVDNIDIYSDSNTLSEAIPGVSLTLNQAEVGTLTNLSVGLDTVAIKDKVKAFVSGYNDVMKFIASQSVTEGSSGGILGGDSGMNAIKRRLQSMLTSPLGGEGSLQTLSQLGLETQKDGTLILDDATLSGIIDEDLAGLTNLLAGSDGVEGIATRFKNYLDDITDSRDGFLVGRKESINSNIRQIDNNIERMEMRLAKREQNLFAQFNALEQLVSTMNAQGDYLTQQLSGMENLWRRDR